PAEVAEDVGEVLDEQPPAAVAVAAGPAGLAQPGRHGRAEPHRRSSAAWRRSLARSSSSPPEASLSPGKAAALTTANDRPRAAEATEASSRVLPIPASPATSSRWPRPSAAAARPGSARG